jgi:hypothetical protein
LKIAAPLPAVIGELASLALNSAIDDAQVLQCKLRAGDMKAGRRCSTLP